MNTPEKRRSGGGGGRSNSTGPAWRTGHATHTSRHGSSAAGGGGGGGGTNTASSGAGGSNSDNLPVMPPRAAMASTSSTGGDDSHNAGGTLLERKRKEKGGRDKDGVAGSSNSNNSSSSTARGSSPHGSNPSGSPVSKQQQQQQQHRRQQHSEAAAAATATATAHVLREKDERIAYLEKEMAIMEREFHQELDKLSQAESETATFWQGKHSALNQQFLRTDTELRLLRAEVDVREAEREELRQGVEVLRRELQDRDDEIRRLRGQVRGLKDFVSTSTRTDDQTSDEVFGDGMTKLGNGLQNWVITNFRKAKLGELQLMGRSQMKVGFEGMVRFRLTAARPVQGQRRHTRRAQPARAHVRGARPHVQSSPPPVHRVEHPRRHGLQRLLRRPIRAGDSAHSTNGAAPLLSLLCVH